MQKKFLLLTGLIFLCVLAVATICIAQNPVSPPANVSLQKDVQYTTVTMPLRMNVVRPTANTSPLPVVICIHGGGWAAGNKDDMLQMCYGLAALGYAAVTVEYRFAPKFNYPTQLEDVRAALKYVRTHASELNIDPSRIGAIGGSAGGHLALLLAETNDAGGFLTDKAGEKPALRAAASLSGPTDFTAKLPDAAVQILLSLMGKPLTDATAAYKEASPIFHLNKNCAPMLLVHGDKDELVPYDQATSMIDACKKAGVSAELFTLHNAGHGGGADKAETEASIKKLAEFFDKNLRH